MTKLTTELVMPKGLIGPEGLMKRPHLPRGYQCPCGQPLPWGSITRSGLDPQISNNEFELACKICSRGYTVFAGRVWEGAY